MACRGDYPALPDEAGFRGGGPPAGHSSGRLHDPAPALDGGDAFARVHPAYVTGRAVGPGAYYLEVFRFAGTTAFIGYALALWQMSIWYRRPERTTILSTIDGLIYAGLTAGVFGWLWPC